ncbi:hypothetical protein PSDVSF_11980 [Pseudodesulfovibrio sediminis]|uniref:Uncharacterized protein n=1 Tax=Pseudodesulfovibrio sediminis TaxID=2810563 RepID=A0ABN6ESB8_9BACT|nr:hypothetical protein PSDVSF_11980 [Pseudodesulfovibrio sediminis]
MPDTENTAIGGHLAIVKPDPTVDACHIDSLFDSKNHLFSLKINYINILSMCHLWTAQTAFGSKKDTARASRTPCSKKR